MIDTLLVIAKEPRPGRVKTRLVPPLTHTQAAELARAALQDSLQAASLVPARRRILALEGAPGPWLPPGWRCVPQADGGLDQRLAHAFGFARGPAVLIGMDTPQLRPSQLAAFDPERYDACLGPAADGGYWAIGFAEPSDAAVIVGVPMSTPQTGFEQLQRMYADGLRVQSLDPLEDVDTFEAAQRVASQRPHGTFGRAVHHLAVDAALKRIA